MSFIVKKKKNKQNRLKKLTQTSCRLFIRELHAVIIVVDSDDVFFAMRFVIGGLRLAAVNGHRAAARGMKKNSNFLLELKKKKNTI